MQVWKKLSSFKAIQRDANLTREPRVTLISVFWFHISSFPKWVGARFKPNSTTAKCHTYRHTLPNTMMVMMMNVNHDGRYQGTHINTTWKLEGHQRVNSTTTNERTTTLWWKWYRYRRWQWWWDGLWLPGLARAPRDPVLEVRALAVDGLAELCAAAAAAARVARFCNCRAFIPEERESVNVCFADVKLKDSHVLQNALHEQVFVNKS